MTWAYACMIGVGGVAVILLNHGLLLRHRRGISTMVRVLITMVEKTCRLLRQPSFLLRPEMPQGRLSLSMRFFKASSNHGNQ